MERILISIPAIVGKIGVEDVIPISLDDEEKSVKNSAILNEIERMIKRTWDRLRKDNCVIFIYAEHNTQRRKGHIACPCAYIP